MSNIVVRKENNGNALATRESDPFRMMRELLRFDPFREMSSMPALEAATFWPAFEVKETKTGFTFKADVPGVAESDIDITRTGNRISISGKRDADREEKSDTYYAYERSYGSFTRSFTLPEGVDGEGIHAELKDGVLTVIAPKKPEAQPQKISLKGLFQKKS